VRGRESFIRKCSITVGLGGLPRTGSASLYSTACQSVWPRLIPDYDKRLARWYRRACSGMIARRFPGATNSMPASTAVPSRHVRQPGNGNTKQVMVYFVLCGRLREARTSSDRSRAARLPVPIMSAPAYKYQHCTPSSLNIDI
jgi:hypothetical protein